MAVALTLTAAAVLAAAWATWGPSQHETTEPGVEAHAGRRPNILLITLDTTRADRIGCYGFGLARTPAIDALAAEGVRATHALASAPVTAPSHASMLTGLYPPAHGVRDNGVHRLPDEVTTLPEILGEHGYRTGAFVSAAVLHHRYNLGQGFATYDDDLWAEDAPAMFFIRERPGERTVDRASAWLTRWHAEQPDQPFFAWVHLFDVHQPHTPEPGDVLLSPTLYDAEIVGVDRQVGRLRAQLEALGVLEDTIVVVTADHGESLGEHGENTHAIFVYEATIHVPLIVRYPARLPAGATYDAPTRHVDLLPTLLALADVSAPGPVQGIDLSEAFAGRADPPASLAYSESLVGEIGFGMAPLFAVRGGSFTYIRAPRRELYDRARDPGELADLSLTRPLDADRWDGEVSAILAESRAFAHAPSTTPMDEETLDQLRALGYVGDATVAESVRGMDPKDGLPVHEDVQHARTLIRARRYDEARRLAERALAVTPHNLTALSLVAICQDRTGDRAGARATYLHALELAPDEARMHHALAILDLAAGGPDELDEAEQHTRRAIELSNDFAEAWVTLGMIAIARGDVSGAAPSFARALEIDPQFPRGLVAHGDLLFRQADYAGALARYREALEVQPHAFHVLNQAAASARRVGDREEALRYLALAEQQRPDSFIPPYNRACLFALEGDRDAALAALADAVARGMPSPQVILEDPDLSAYRDDPELRRLASLIAEPTP